MTGFSLEDFNQKEVREGGFLIRRECLDNGIRVVTVENLESVEEMEDAVLSMECFEEEPSLDTCLDSLRSSLEHSDGEISDEIRAAIVRTGQCLDAYIRGVSGTEATGDFPRDGVVYVSVPALRSGEMGSVQGQVDAILEQLRKYAEQEME